MHPDLDNLVSSVSVSGERSYALLGETRAEVGADGVPPELADFGSLDAYRDPAHEPTALVSFLAAEIYGRLYCRSEPVSASTDMLTRREFIAALSRANNGAGSWDPDWTMHRADGDGVAVARGEVLFWTRLDRVRFESSTPQPSRRCRVRIRNEFRHFITGFYTALGDNWHGLNNDQHRLLRVYFNFTSAGAMPFIGMTTRLLNHAGVPFRAKVLGDPAHYVRADSGVLYVGRDDFERCAPLLQHIACELRPYLREHSPRLTKALRPGVGVAESPRADSFGAARSKLLACALWSCWRRGVDDAERLAYVADFFAARGVDPDRPYLEPDGVDRYTLGQDALDPSPPARPRLTRHAHEVVAARPDDLVAGALDIGRELCEAAIWDSAGMRCNWLGRKEKTDPAVGAVPCTGALGPDLYAGTTGVALFLTDALGFGLDASAAEVAAGGLRTAVDVFKSGRAERLISPLSFFAGQLGIAYVATRLMRAAPEIDLRDELRWLISRVQRADVADSPVDLVSGCAGAIPCLLVLAEEPGLELCADLALRCGERLRAAAVWHDDGTCAWMPDRTVLGTAPLTGMSHGSAGPARALLELYAKTGRRSFLDTARAAYAFEDACFSPSAANWVDTRAPYRGESGRREGRCITAWCHGAGGIALGRARAARLDPESVAIHVSKIRAAAPTLISALAARQAARVDATLCHGTCGLSETMLTLGELLGDEDFRRRGVDAAHTLLATRDVERPWPSAIPGGGPNPTLMIGSSGIGHHLLRAACARKLPSVLLLAP